MRKTHPLIAATGLTLLVAGCGTDSSQPLGPSPQDPRPGGSPALAVERLRVQSKGTSARAGFSSTDPSGCVETSVFVVGAEGSIKVGPGAPSSTGSVAFLDLEQFDSCNGTGLVVFGEFTDGVSFQATKTLTEARLQGTIVGTDDISGAEVQVVLDLAWTATGKLTRQSSKQRFQLPGILIFQSTTNAFREATASGSVSVGGVNLTPDPSVFASIGGDTDLEIEHTTS